MRADTTPARSRLTRGGILAGFILAALAGLWLFAGGTPQVGAAPAPNPQGTEDSAWQQLPDMPVPRWEPGTAVIDDVLYLFGGYTVGTKSSKRADFFDPAKNTWRRLADLPSAITHINAVADGRSVWIAGGFKDGYKGKAIAEVWKYDIDNGTYVAARPLPEPRAGGGLALVRKRLHYIGGLMADRDTDSADPLGDRRGRRPGRLRRLEARRTDARAPQSVQHGHSWREDLRHRRPVPSRQRSRGSTAHRRLRSLDRLVEQRPGSPAAALSRRREHFSEWRRIFMMGGMTRGGGEREVEAAIWVLSSDGTAWGQAGELPKPLSSPAAAIIGGQLVVAGGSPDGKDPQPGVWVREAP